MTQNRKHFGDTEDPQFATGAETVSIRSIDVGFDLRAHKDMICSLPAGTTHVLCDLLPGPITGTTEQILRRLRGLGYRVRFATHGGA